MKQPLKTKKANNGPIPGENFTSDTRNYPWHRPPEHNDLNSAMEEVIEKLMDPKTEKGLMVAMELDMDIATMTDIIVTQGMAAGKWTPDFALLLAGPTARLLELMANKNGIKYKTGWEDKTEIPDAETLKYYAKYKKELGMQEELDPDAALADQSQPQPEPTPDEAPAEQTAPPQAGFAAPIPTEGM